MWRHALMVLAALPAIGFGADLRIEIPPVPVSLDISGQPIAITISGDIAGSGQSLNLNLRADLSDFQHHLTPLLQAELNQSNRCGERITIENASLTPAAPSGQLAVQLHFEKWACFKAFGKENAKKLLGGSGTVNMILTPRVEHENAGSDGSKVRLDAEIGSIDADGSLGELLRSDYGAVLSDKIRAALMKAIQKSASLEAVVPVQARPFVTIQSVGFADRGNGSLGLNLAGRLTVPVEQASALVEQFRNYK
jgi:hypothetical protein